MRIVVNRHSNGLQLSDKAIEMYLDKRGITYFKYKHTKYRFEDGQDEYTKCNSFDISNDKYSYYFLWDRGEKFNEIRSCNNWDGEDIQRNNADLIAIVEQLGKEANRYFDELEIVEIPDDVDWEIYSYDGETIHEAHRVW